VADDLDLDLLAASLRADAGDLDAFVEGLAAKLENVLPAQTRITRKRHGLTGPKLVRAIDLDAADARLALARDGHRVTCTRGRLSGGIVLKTEELTTDLWLEAVGAALAAEAERSAITRQALERLLMQ
jgi:hypothetical protein